MGPGEHLESLPLQRVILPGDRDAIGITIEVVVGSVSCFPCTPSRMGLFAGLKCR
jgi:hypothetical protein